MRWTRGVRRVPRNRRRRLRLLWAWSGPRGRPALVVALGRQYWQPWQHPGAASGWRAWERRLLDSSALPPPRLSARWKWLRTRPLCGRGPHTCGRHRAVASVAGECRPPQQRETTAPGIPGRFHPLEGACIRISCTAPRLDCGVGFRTPGRPTQRGRPRRRGLVSPPGAFVLCSHAPWYVRLRRLCCACGASPATTLSNRCGRVVPSCPPLERTRGGEPSASGVSAAAASSRAVVPIFNGGFTRTVWTV